MGPVEAAYAEEVARLEGRQRELQAFVEELEVRVCKGGRGSVG